MSNSMPVLLRGLPNVAAEWTLLATAFKPTLTSPGDVNSAMSWPNQQPGERIGFDGKPTTLLQTP